MVASHWEKLSFVTYVYVLCTVCVSQWIWQPVWFCCFWASNVCFTEAILDLMNFDHQVLFSAIFSVQCNLTVFQCINAFWMWGVASRVRLFLDFCLFVFHLVSRSLTEVFSCLNNFIVCGAYCTRRHPNKTVTSTQKIVQCMCPAEGAPSIETYLKVSMAWFQ